MRNQNIINSRGAHVVEFSPGISQLSYILEFIKTFSFRHKNNKKKHTLYRNNSAEEEKLFSSQRVVNIH